MSEYSGSEGGFGMGSQSNLGMGPETLNKFSSNNYVNASNDFLELIPRGTKYYFENCGDKNSIDISKSSTATQ